MAAVDSEVSGHCKRKDLYLNASHGIVPLFTQGMCVAVCE